MKKFGKLVTGLFGLAMVTVTILPAGASMVYSHRVELEKFQAWTKMYGAGRSFEEHYVSARCEAVYPAVGVDNYKKIQCRVVDGSSVVMTTKDYYVLTEGERGYTDMELKKEYRDNYQVCFQFRGNSNSPAYAQVAYTGN